jgi:L-2,4-diaminobutyrate decarboxylase
MADYDESLRRSAHALVDLIFDHRATIPQKKVVDWRSPEELRESFALGETERGGASLESLAAELLASANQFHHPGYMGHQVGPPFGPAVLADLLISYLNQSTAVWEMSPAATVIEKEIVRWLCDKVGWSDQSGGTAVSGGSAANLTALLAARSRWIREHELEPLRPVIVCSTQSHYSLARAAAVLGLSEAEVVRVGCDPDHGIDLEELGSVLQEIEDDPSRSVMAIVATAGSTSTGSFDRLHEIADLRDRYRTWLHVDGAHGASLLLSTRMRGMVAGIERADSISWDPHKMLWMPLSLGVVLMRDEAMLRRAFHADAPYLFQHGAAPLNLGEMTIQCSRRADAVKLWITLRMWGEEPFIAALEKVTDLTASLYQMVRTAPDFEPVHQPRFNIFCFRWTGAPGKAGDPVAQEVTDLIRQRLIESGEAWITATTVGGERVLRVTLINPRTTEDDLRAMLASVRRVASELRAEGKQ